MDSFIKSAFIKILMPCIVIRIRTQPNYFYGTSLHGIQGEEYKQASRKSALSEKRTVKK